MKIEHVAGTRYGFIVAFQVGNTIMCEWDLDRDLKYPEADIGCSGYGLRDRPLWCAATRFHRTGARREELWTIYGQASCE